MKMNTTALLLIGALTLTGAAHAQKLERDNAKLRSAMVQLAQLSELFEKKYASQWQHGVDVSGKSVYAWADQEGFLRGFVGNFRGGLGFKLTEQARSARPQLQKLNEQLSVLMDNMGGNADEADGNRPLDDNYRTLHKGQNGWEALGGFEGENFKRAQADCARLKSLVRNALTSLRQAVRAGGGADADQVFKRASDAAINAAITKSTMGEEDRLIYTGYK